ncbi:MAG: hypothetical protein NC111_04695 [Bacteroides sp.]|nr:hypothetical protein [Bacteroides sp.]MCM1413978.1 hypothetical protein [Bacteroides sp.]MCM1471805.1 hypothetical protein [Bacteroides sp.]
MKKFYLLKLLSTVFCVFCLMACGTDTVDDPQVDDPITSNGDPYTSGDDSESEVKEPEPLNPEIRPIISAGKKWVTETVTVYGSVVQTSSSICTEMIVGDTIIDGIKAKTTYRIYNDELTTKWTPIYEQDGVVYRYFFTTNCDAKGWTPVYSISSKNEEQYGVEYDNVIAVSRGTIEVMGKLRRAVKYKTTCENYCLKHYRNDYAIEGIGFVYGSQPEFYRGSTVKPTGFYGKWKVHLLYCYDGDELIFDHETFDPSTYKEIEVYSECGPDTYTEYY